MVRNWQVRVRSGLVLWACIAVFVTAHVARATTPTPTPTQKPCATTTPEALYVDPVISPTDELTQTIYVHTGNSDRLEVSSEAGTFLGEHPFDQVEVSLLPNTANHLRVTTHVRRIVEDGCIYGDYTLTTTNDLHGAPLTIVQGTTHGPTIAVEPATITVTCSAAFEIRLRNASEGDDVLDISFISLHHAYSQGDYGTDFTWDISGIDLPLMLSPGEFVSIPVSYRGTGLFDSRLVLQVVSNARNNNSTQYLAYEGKRCPTPTPTGPTATGTVTPTETPDPLCPPLVGLSPAAGPPGTVVVMEGTCYWIHSGRSAGVYFDDELIGEVSGLTGGDFRTLIQIPAGTNPGIHAIRLSQSNGFELTSGAFDVTGSPGSCTGDCNRDGRVDVAEVVTSIGIALGRLDPSECLDAGSIGEGVTIADIVAAVRNTLQGCTVPLDVDSFGGAYTFLGAFVNELSYPDPVQSSAGEVSVVDGEVFVRIDYPFGTIEVSGAPEEDGQVTLDGFYQENVGDPVPTTGSAILSQIQSDEWIGGELVVHPPEPLVSQTIRFSMHR